MGVRVWGGCPPLMLGEQQQDAGWEEMGKNLLPKGFSLPRLCLGFIPSGVPGGALPSGRCWWLRGTRPGPTAPLLPQNGALPLSACGQGCRAHARSLHCFPVGQGPDVGGPVFRWGLRFWGGALGGGGAAVVTRPCVPRPLHRGRAGAHLL